MRDMLLRYRQKPSKELLDMIEAEFSTDVVKQVAGGLAVAKGQLQQSKLEARRKETETAALNYLTNNVGKYREEFNNKDFVNLYAEAFKIYGETLDTDKFVDLTRKYADSVLKKAGIKQNIVKENQNETDEIEGLSANGSNAEFSSSGKSLLNMSASELDKRLTELI